MRSPAWVATSACVVGLALLGPSSGTAQPVARPSAPSGPPAALPGLPRPAGTGPRTDVQPRATCDRAKALADELQAALRRLADAVRAARLDPATLEQVGRMYEEAGTALCCTVGPLLDVPPFVFQAQAYCAGTTQGRYSLPVAACAAMASDAVAHARALASAPLPPAIAALVEDVRRLVEALRAAAQDCAAQRPAPPPPPSAGSVGLGGACPRPLDCAAGLVCGPARTCQRVGVLRGGACDASQLCAPGLDCRGGTCRLPCACPIECSVESFASGGRCSRAIAETRRESCRTFAGRCPHPCFNAGGSCVVDRPTGRTTEQPCALRCE